MNNRPTIPGILLLSALSALVAILVISNTADSRDSPLRSMLSDESCARECWRGIEVGVTERDIVTRMLDDAEIDVYVIEGVGNEGYAVYEFMPPANWTIVDADNSASYAVIVFGGGVVSHIGIPIDVCVSNVIDAYDVPAKVNAVTDFTYLLYPDHRLIFSVAPKFRDLNLVSSVSLTTDEGMLEVLDNDYLQDWADIADDFSGECDDSLSR